MLLTLPLVAAAAASGPILSAQVVERLKVPSSWAAVDLDVNAYDGTVTLEAPDGKPSRSQLARLKSTLCPDVEAQGSTVTLRCTTQLLDASFQQQSGQAFLDLRQLRGLPFREGRDGIQTFYRPEDLQLGACGGDEPAARGECLLRDGAVAEATAQFTLGLETRGRELSAVRLGDLALRQGDLVGALTWYARVGETGPWARMTRARVCELGASCDRSSFDGTALPAPLQLDLRLRSLRYTALTRPRAEALAQLAAELDSADAAALLAEGTPTVRRIVLMGLRSPQGQERQALALYLGLPHRAQGPLAADLAAAAAEVAQAMGAPAFAANLLAAAQTEVPPARLSGHLLRATELYLAAKDAVRAQVIVEFAQLHLGRRDLSTDRWQAAMKACAPGGDGEGRSRRRGRDREHEREHDSAKTDPAKPDSAEDLTSASKVLERAHAVGEAHP
jgi:hypothetical protein